MTRITVVTPSYNQGDYLEEAINSVLDQGVEVEYLIMDGGSTDRSVEIIRKYERHLAHWQSQPDGGQTHAIAEGFRRSTGHVLCWLNSDDAFEPGVLKKVRDAFEDPQLELLYGDYALVYPDGRRVAKPKVSFDYDICLYAYLMIPQLASFWTRRLYDEVGGLNTEYQYSFDYELFLKFGKHLQDRPGSIRHVQDLWGRFRVHDQSKSVSQQERFSVENERILAQLGATRNRWLRAGRSYFESARLLMRFYQERGIIPVRKEGGKA